MLYQDRDIVEIAVNAWNGMFGGIVQVYVAHDELEGVANRLRGFPSSPADERNINLGTFDPKLAGGGASMRFFCTDRAGHAQLKLKLSGRNALASRPQSVELFANVEPASIDEFLPQLIALSRSTRNAAALRFADALNR